MIDLDERNHIIELKFQLTVEWFEYRATYQNLKTNKALNVLSTEELREIWIPFIIFKVLYIQNIWILDKLKIFFSTIEHRLE